MTATAAPDSGAALPCLARWQALLAAAPQAPALLLGEGPVTRAGLAELAAEMAAGMARAGLGPGGAAVLSLANGPALAAAPLAVWSLGALPVFVPPEAPAAHLEAALAASGAALVLTGAPGPGETWPRPQPGPGGGPGALPGPKMGPEMGAAPGPAPGAAGSVLFTSGSSGRPKGVVQTHATLRAATDNLARVIGYRDDDRLLAAVPWSHDYGWTQLLTLYLRGLPLALPEGPGAAGLCAAIAAHRPSVFGGVPSLFGLLTHGISDIRKTPRDSLRLLMSTGSHMPAELAEALDDLFPGAGLRLNFGLTETFRTASLAPEARARRPGSSGQALPGVEISIIDADGRALPPGQEGEIVHRGVGAFAGYLGDPELTARVQTLPDGGRGVRTGDLGHLDAEGYLYVTGRRDRQVKAMGLRLHLDEVERLLRALPGVAEAAAIARPHPITGAQVAAAIVPEPGAEGLARQVRAALPAHMRPRPLKLMPALPRRPNGKVDYPRLQDML